MKAVLHGGTIEKYIGDAIMAVFGLPKLHEDDALRAVRAAHGMQEALRELNQDLLARYGVELTNRTGVNTGEVVAGDPTTGQRLVTGDAVNTAARLEQAAPANEILIGGLTNELVRGFVDVEEVEPLELKGKAERAGVSACRTDRGRGARARGLPLVGRDRELAILEESLADAYVTQQCRLVTVVGDPASASRGSSANSSRSTHPTRSRCGVAASRTATRSRSGRSWRRSAWQQRSATTIPPRPPRHASSGCSIPTTSSATRSRRASLLRSA